MNRSDPAAVAMRCAVQSSRSRMLRQLVAHAVLPAALLLLAGRVAAVGPEAPVDFVDTYLPKGFLVMVVEPSQVTDVELIRSVHLDGEPLSRTPVKWTALRMLDYDAPITGPEHFRYRAPDEREQGTRPRIAVRTPDFTAAQPRPGLSLARPGTPLVVNDERPKRVGVMIPLEPEAHRALKDGAYAERYAVRVRLAGAGERDKPLTMARWVHFMVRDGRVEYVDQATYSRIADPASDALDGAGGKILVQTGRGVKADVPLERTRRNKAVPLGRLGGATVEREAAPRERDRSEANER